MVYERKEKKNIDFLKDQIWTKSCFRFYICFFFFSIVADNPDVAMDSVVHITQQMTSSQRAEASRIIATMESGPTSPQPQWRLYPMQPTDGFFLAT